MKKLFQRTAIVATALTLTLGSSLLTSCETEEESPDAALTSYPWEDKTAYIVGFDSGISCYLNKIERTDAETLRIEFSMMNILHDRNVDVTFYLPYEAVVRDDRGNSYSGNDVDVSIDNHRIGTFGSGHTYTLKRSAPIKGVITVSNFSQTALRVWADINVSSNDIELANDKIEFVNLPIDAQ